MSVRVIGEPGCTAEGQIDLMLAQIDAVAEGGADAYKATWIQDREAVIRQRRMSPAAAARYRDVYGWHQWPIGWHERLARRCEAVGLAYACTVHTPGAASAVAPYVSALKVASFESTSRPLIEAALATGREVWVSLGMSRASDRGWLKAVRASCSRLRLFLCTSAYPCRVKDLHLARIRAQGLDGLSDHSDPTRTYTGALGVKEGARDIEAHVRPASCRPSNPDYAVAMDARQWAAYVSAIRDPDQSLREIPRHVAVEAHGDPDISTLACEDDMRRYRVEVE